MELARALAQHPAVYRVDLLTRLIKDPQVDKSYGEPEECILRSEGELGGAYIVRLACGPTEEYLRYFQQWQMTEHKSNVLKGKMCNDS